jgi:hypothetical protein
MTDNHGADGTRDVEDRAFEDSLADPDEEGVVPGEAPHQDREGEIPVAGSEALAERIEEAADGDRNGDGEPDGPQNVPFPG